MGMAAMAADASASIDALQQAAAHTGNSYLLCFPAADVFRLRGGRILGLNDVGQGLDADKREYLPRTAAGTLALGGFGCCPYGGYAICVLFIFG